MIAACCSGRTVVVIEFSLDEIRQQSTGTSAGQNLHQHAARAAVDLHRTSLIVSFKQGYRRRYSAFLRLPSETIRGRVSREVHSAAASAENNEKSQPEQKKPTGKHGRVCGGGATRAAQGAYGSEGSAAVGIKALPDMCIHTGGASTGKSMHGDVQASTTSTAVLALTPAAATTEMRPAAAWRQCRYDARGK